jgi:integrase/recombinase XerD
MLERYFVFPRTVDRIRNSWIGEPIERYVKHLAEQGYAAGTMHYRVPLLVKFGEFARSQGAKALAELPAYAEDFIADWIRTRGSTGRCGQPRPGFTKEIRGPVEQFLRLVVPGFIGHVRGATARVPFVDSAPGFFGHLSEERGLRPSTLWHYGHHLRGFEDFLNKIDLDDLSDLTPPVLAAFVADSSRRLGKTGVRDLCGTLRVLLRYLYRERVVPKDLSTAVDAPHAYRLSHIPRSVTWEEVRKMLSVVERRMPVGKRDYAILLLLVTYGLRAREVAALMLDHIDWKRERLHIPDCRRRHSRLPPTRKTEDDRSSPLFPQCRPLRPAHLFRDFLLRQPLSSQSGDSGLARWLAYASPHLRAAAGRCRLLAQGDRRLRRPSRTGLNRNL